MISRLLAKLHAFLCCVDTGKEVDIFSLFYVHVNVTSVNHKTNKKFHFKGFLYSEMRHECRLLFSLKVDREDHF